MSIEYEGFNLPNEKRSIYSNVLELVGNTPLIYLNSLSFRGAQVLAKLEMLNPSSSIKDRLALAMIIEARQKGLKEGGTVVTASSGNTGIGLAMLCAALGYECVITMPDGMSAERQQLINAYGAHVVLTPATDGMVGSLKKAEKLSDELGYVLINQFDSQCNAQIHYLTTGPEIWRDTNGNIDILVCGVGSGGTISGCGRFLKEKDPKVWLVAVEPDSSPVLSGGQAGSHRIQGIGAGFVPHNLQKDLIDQVVTISDEDAFAASRLLAKQEGLLCGISSGAVAAAAMRLSLLPGNKDKRIVIILPDTGQRYLSLGVL
jgi:cysteine synthase A